MKLHSLSFSALPLVASQSSTRPLMGRQRDTLHLRFGSQKEASALINAVMYEGLEAVQRLATPENINVKDKYGWTALMLAAQKGTLDVVKALLEKVADVNAKDESGHSALMLAAENGHPEIVKALIAAGAPLKDLNVGFQLWFLQQTDPAKFQPFLKNFRPSLSLSTPLQFPFNWSRILNRLWEPSPTEKKEQDLAPKILTAFIQENESAKKRTRTQIEVTPSRYSGTLQGSPLLLFFNSLATFLSEGGRLQFKHPVDTHSHWITFTKKGEDSLEIQYRDNELASSKTDINQTITLNLTTGAYTREGYILVDGKPENEDSSFREILLTLALCMKGMGEYRIGKGDTRSIIQLKQGIPLALLPVWKALHQAQNTWDEADEKAQWYNALMEASKQ